MLSVTTTQLLVHFTLVGPTAAEGKNRGEQGVDGSILHREGVCE